jgi:hypothetical protein
MVHMGYFTWSCAPCRIDCKGDLPRHGDPTKGVADASIDGGFVKAA